MSIWKMIPAALVLAACASSNQTGAVAAPDPSATPATAAVKATTPTAVAAADVIEAPGDYEFSTLVDGQTVTGTLTITGTPGNYTGKIVTNLFPEILVTGASVENKTVTVKASMPDGELTIKMLMDGMNFTGNWEIGGDTGDFSGKKLPRK